MKRSAARAHPGAGEGSRGRTRQLLPQRRPEGRPSAQGHRVRPTPSRAAPRPAGGPGPGEGRRSHREEARRQQVPARHPGPREGGRPPLPPARSSPGLPHDVAVAAVAGAPRLAPEHVVVVPGVLALVEALRAQAHAGRDPAGPAAVGHEVGRPHQAAQRGRVVGPHGLHEAVPGLPARQQAAAPLQRFARRLAAARARRRGQHPLQQRPQLAGRRRAVLAAQSRLQPRRRLPLIPAASAGPRHDAEPRGRYGRAGLPALGLPSPLSSPLLSSPPSRRRLPLAIPRRRAASPLPWHPPLPFLCLPRLTRSRQRAGARPAPSGPGFLGAAPRAREAEWGHGRTCRPRVRREDGWTGRRGAGARRSALGAHRGAEPCTEVGGA